MYIMEKFNSNTIELLVIVVLDLLCVTGGEGVKNLAKLCSVINDWPLKLQFLKYGKTWTIVKK